MDSFTNEENIQNFNRVVEIMPLVDQLFRSMNRVGESEELHEGKKERKEVN